MAQPAFSQQPGKPAVRSGGVLGITLGVIHSVIIIILYQINNAQQNSGSNTSSTSTILILLIPLLWIVGLLAAGTWGSTSTGKVGTGTLAGLFAGIFGGVIAGFGQIIAIALVSTSANPSTSNGALLGLGLASIFYVLFLAVGAGAGLGALGGLIGQSISPVRTQTPGPVALPVYASPVMQVPYPAAQPYPQPQQPFVPQTPLPQQPAAPQAPATPPLPEQ